MDLEYLEEAFRDGSLTQFFRRADDALRLGRYDNARDHLRLLAHFAQYLAEIAAVEERRADE
jgi:hypothetical protein